MKSKMIIDTYESAAKARPRAALLNKACEDFEDEKALTFSAQQATQGFAVWVEFDKDTYPSFQDVEVVVRSTSISYRKRLREEKAAKAAK